MLTHSRIYLMGVEMMVACRTPSMRNRREIMNALDSERNTFAANDVMKQASIEMTSMEAEIAQLTAERDRMLGHLKQALGQWAMYADMVERNDGFELAKEQSPEGDLYRAAMAAVDEQSAPKEGK